MFPSCYQRQKMAELGSGWCQWRWISRRFGPLPDGSSVEEVEYDSICLGEDGGTATQKMIDHNQPFQQQALKWKGGLALAVSQGTDNLEDNFLVNLSRRIQITDEGPQAGLVQMAANSHQVNDPAKLLGEGAPVVEDRDGSLDGGLDGKLATLCRDFCSW